MSPRNQVMPEKVVLNNSAPMPLPWIVVIQEVFNLNLHYAECILSRKIFIDISDENYRAGEKTRRKISNVSICRDLGCPLFANEEVSSQKAMWIAFSKVCVRYMWDQRLGEESRLKCMFSSPVRWTASSSTKDRNSQRFSIPFPLGMKESTCIWRKRMIMSIS